ncbi:MAG: tRNA-intron lyase [archaeon]|jgi:tRNA-intron lyase
MKVILENYCGLIKDNNLKSKFTQKGFGFKKENNLYIDLFECLYFLEKKKISIVDKNNKIIAKEKLENICEKEITDFKNKFLVFKDFTENGYIVKDGTIFGFDFRIYKKSKSGEHTHTEIVVDVIKTHKTNAITLLKSERLATTIHTKYILAIVDKDQKIHKLKIEKL